MAKEKSRGGTQKHAHEPIAAEELPAPLALAYAAYQEEKEPFRRVHRLIDTVEVLVKLHTAIAMSRFFCLREITDDLKGLMCGGLKTPSLGIWWAFAREFTKAVKDEDTGPGASSAAYTAKRGSLFKAMEGKNDLISFRNKYAHGATPPDEKCRADIEMFAPRVEALLQRAYHLRDLELVAVKEDGSTFAATGKGLSPFSPISPESSLAPGRCYMRDPSGGSLMLHPLLVFRESDGLFYFYNDLKKHEASFLNYENCRHQRDRQLKEEILQHFPIHEWAQSATDTFREKIEVLTETFRGRKKELERLIDFITTWDKGFLFFWGGPGVGKSALTARVFQMLNWTAAVREEFGIGADIPAENFTVIEYFIRREMRTNTADDFFSYIHARLESRFRTGVPQGKALAEKQKNLDRQIKEAAAKLGENERLILIIDGLDEATESPELLESLPRMVPDKVLVIYASREHPDVKSRVYDLLEREHRTFMNLSGLTQEDTRSLLYDVVDKYRLEKGYVKALCEKSLGNPLYINLVCLGLARNEYRVNDSLYLPDGLAEIYEKVFERICSVPHAADFFRMLALARDYVTPDMAAGILNTSLDAVRHSVLPACMELLFENPLTEDIIDYQLFHESLREFILEKPEYAGELKRWRSSLCDWCEGWQDLSGPARAYALRHLVAHLDEEYRQAKEEGDEARADACLKRMTKALDDPHFREQSYLSCGNAGPLKDAFWRAQKILADRDTDARHMDRIFSYARLMHEEEADMYAGQLNSMLQAATAGHLVHADQVARMGATPKDRLLLALRAVWAAPHGTRLPPALEQSARKWLKEAADPVMERLWKKSANRLQKAG